MPDPFERRSGNSSNDTSSRRPTRRDRDRILYSDSFRRLGGVTQVALGDPALQLHNRLTHSLKVEQVGSSIYSTLIERDAEVSAIVNLHEIEAACLGHDIGHPPFGHAGEAEMQELLVCPEHIKLVRSLKERLKDPCNKCLLEDGFEGNAQSFRALAVLAVHRDSADKPYGLDLTRASLAAVSKYPWSRGAVGRKPHKWGAYDCDVPILEWVFGSVESDQNTASAIMDWADDISYAVHDIEDFYKTGHIPLENYSRVTSDISNDHFEEFMEYVESPDAVGQVSDTCKKDLPNYFAFLPRSRFTGRPADLGALDRMRSRYLSQFISAASLEGQRLKVEDLQREINAVMKQFVWYHVIDEPALSSIQKGQRRVIREIFKDLRPMLEDIYKIGQMADPSQREQRALPYALRRAIEFAFLQESHYTERQKVARGLVDYIAGLSDSEAYTLHAVLKGREGYGQIH